MIEEVLEPLVCDRFRNDERYREGHLRVVNALPGRRVMGLHSPEIKQAAKELSRSGFDYIASFEAANYDALSYEEIVIWGYLINMRKCSVEERLTLLQRYIPVLDNWAVCDSYCAHAKWMAKMDRGPLWRFLLPWFSSKREFEVRFAVVASMCYLLTEECLDKLFDAIATIDFDSVQSDYKSIKGRPAKPSMGVVQGREPYYVRMGVAWLLATALAKFPDATRSFVRTGRLPEDVLRLYVRKARESFRTRHVAAM